MRRGKSTLLSRIQVRYTASYNTILSDTRKNEFKYYNSVYVCVWAGPLQAETTTLLLLLIYSNILNFDLPAMYILSARASADI